jgi:hypothetical protein
LAEGTHTFTTTATDGAGNISLPSSPIAVTIDTSNPLPPVIKSPAITRLPSLETQSQAPLSPSTILRAVHLLQLAPWSLALTALTRLLLLP